MEVFTFVRRSAVLLVVVAIAAGCAATPDESRGPGDANCDGDRDGIPDGQSPVEGTNSTCDDANATMPGDDAGGNETEPTMPGVLP